MTYVVDNRYCIIDTMVTWSYCFFWWCINSLSLGNYTNYCYSTVAYK